MERVELVVKERESAGSRTARRLRREGVIPGVLYGSGKPATPIAIDPHALREAVSTGHGTHAVFDVVFEGQKTRHHAIIQEMQLDRVKDLVTHVDLREVKLSEPIEADVGVSLEGTAPGVKAGGLLETVIHEIRVKALPGDIPEHLVLEIGHLELGQVARVSELVVPEGVTVLSDPDETVVTVIPPRGATEEEEAEEAAAAAAAEGEEPAEPELVGKGREAGEEEA